MSPQPSSSTGAVRPAATHPRGLRWTVVVALAAMSAIGLVLLFLLTQATNNRELYERNYALLFGLNVVVAAVLFLIITWIGVRLFVRLRKKRFGSRLLVKLAAVFALAGFAPGMLIYVVSYQFVSRSIETWFDVKVEGALDAGLNLGRVSLETLSDDLTNKARLSSSQLSSIPDAAVTLPLERLRDQLGARDVGLFSGSGQLITGASQSQFQLSTARPSAQQFRSARGARSVTWVEGLDEATPDTVNDARIKVLVLVPNPSFALLAEPRFLLVTQALPGALVTNALAVTQAYREYQERSLAREGLKRMYIGTLTLSLFLAVFGAVLLAVVLGNQIVRPLLLLADGVSKVAAGDLTPKVTLSSRDELGGLTRDFADMTQQLADARHAVSVSMEQVDAARSNLQTILDNLTAGVIVLSADGVIRSSNPGATRIMRLPMAAFEGRRLAEIEGLKEFAQQIQSRFDAFLGERSADGLDHWQQSFELGGNGNGAGAGNLHNENAIVLVARGAKLPGTDRLLVFDDISEIVSAQRAQAWGEVARRLAHEIKNPLTPIQLSAERLEMKLSGKVSATEQVLLTKSVKTIVDQVDAMKRLVNEFRDYARLPAAELKPLDLNALLTDVLHLYETDGASVPVRPELDPRCPHILGDAQQLRQVVHNLLQNAQDASVSAPAEPGVPREVVIRTVWVPASRRVRLVVQDRGGGFADNILKRAFEPYVTTKTKGTGLGLAVVKKIADEHGSRIDLANRVEDGKVLGAQVSLSFAVDNKDPDSGPA